MTDSESILQDQFAKDFSDLVSDREQDHQPFVTGNPCPECSGVEMVQITLTKFQAWVLMSQLQLALRHPENVGLTSEIAKTLALRLQTATATTEALYTVAECGWNPEFDI